MRRILLFTLAFGLLSPFASAQSDAPDARGEGKSRLTIGDQAPPLQVGNWVKGDPILSFQKDHVYVLDFWATWCGPCIRAIPHMTKIQKKYADKNVHVLGVSIWESKPSGVTAFVSGKGDEMGYTIAQDSMPSYPTGIEEGSREASRWASDKGVMSQTWMKAAGRNGIPSVFIVDQKGRVAWIGHPMGGMDEALDEIVAGTYDIEKAAEAQEKAEAARALTAKLNELFKDKKYDKAMAFFRENYASWSDDAMQLNMVAWTIVDPAGDVKNKDLDLAMKAAVRANELTKGQNAAILDTVARVHFLKGHVAKALELQRKAVELAPEQMKAQLEEVLREYEKASGESL